MKVRGWRFSYELALICGLAISSLSAQKEAKLLHDQGMVEADQCTGLKKVCRAASIDKKYKKDCDDFAVALNISSNRNLTTGYERLEATPPSIPSALRYASNVCDYDSALAAKKRELLDAIKAAQPPVVAQSTGTSGTSATTATPKDEVSAPKALEAERAFATGDFEAAGAAARQVVDKTLQPGASSILQKIASYNSALQEARQKENSDPQGAIQSYRSALNIAVRGPGDPAGRIASLESRLRAANAVPPGPGPRPPVPTNLARPAADPGVEAARLDAEGRQAEGRNLQEALKFYQSAQRVQPGNAEAVAAQIRVQGLINSDPKEQAKVLADAIRAFYGFNYAEAEDDLTSYLSSTTAKYRGAAHFYLGATRLYRAVLDGSGHKLQDALSSPQVQRPFKDARTACYRPVDKYLSPVVLDAWSLSAGNAGCAR